MGWSRSLKAFKAARLSSNEKRHRAPKEETMNDRVLADLGPDERKLLAVLARYGQDGRAITARRA